MHAQNLELESEIRKKKSEKKAAESRKAGNNQRCLRVATGTTACVNR